MVEEYDVKKQFEEFFSEYMHDQLVDTAAAFPEKRSIEVDFAMLDRFSNELADALQEKPDVYLSLAEDAIQEMGLAPDKKFRPHVRVFGLRPTYFSTVQHLGAEHLNKLVAIEGTVTMISQIQPKMAAALWQCVHCDETIKTIPQKNNIVKPTKCKCGYGDFRLLESSSDFVDIQRSELQDPMEKIKGNITAPKVKLWIEDDLTNVVSPGENVVLVGVLRLMQNPQAKGRTSVYLKYFDVVHMSKQKKEFEELEVSKEEEEKIIELAKNPRLYDLITASVAPSIYGFDEAKMAIALQLFGGTPNKMLPDGKKIRSDIHVLLVGDPGTAKSTILQYVKDLAPKAIYVAGRGASGVGLTASAERDPESEEGWILKAGALVLASGGIVMVDEFDKMEKDDRSAIHEALEQQTISIAKAGMVTQFKAKTSVLAAANPKMGRFDPMTPPASQFDIPPTLMSRFDLIFTIKDVLDEARDRKMVDHILLGHKLAASKKAPEPGSAIVPAIDLDLLKKYISFARRKVFPVLSEEAGTRIKEYYLELRKLGAKQNNYPVTAREIEGLIRLSEASAKMRLSQVVDLIDAERAVQISSYVLNDIFMDRSTGRIDSDIISIGQPKSKVDKLRQLLGVINALEQQYDLVDIDEIVKQAGTLGFDENYARRLIDELKRQGDLYEPKVGFVKSSRAKEW